VGVLSKHNSVYCGVLDIVRVMHNIAAEQQWRQRVRGWDMSA
jgi:hypothetical protein